MPRTPTNLVCPILHGLHQHGSLSTDLKHTLLGCGSCCLSLSLGLRQGGLRRRLLLCQRRRGGRACRGWGQQSEGRVYVAAVLLLGKCRLSRHHTARLPLKTSPGLAGHSLRTAVHRCVCLHGLRRRSGSCLLALALGATGRGHACSLLGLRGAEQGAARQEGKMVRSGGLLSAGLPPKQRLQWWQNAGQPASRPALPAHVPAARRPPAAAAGGAAPRSRPQRQPDPGPVAQPRSCC